MKPNKYVLDAEKVAEDFLPMVKRIALDVHTALPHNVELDDLIQEGLLALVDALKRYDPSRGVKLSTFLSLRVKGAMYDYLRRLDWMPRSRRRAIKCVERAIVELSEIENELPTDERIAKYCGITTDAVKKARMDLAARQLLRLDAYLEGHDLPSESSTEEAVYREILKEHLELAIRRLSEREQLILSLRFEKELNLREIALVIGVTESRVSQLLNAALAKLRKFLGFEEEGV